MKQKSLAKLKKDLWKIMSERIRREASDENGIATCVSCGVRKHWKMLQGGHYVPQSMGDALRFDERNVHVQCLTDNVYQKEKGMVGYARFMVKKYGEGILEELDKIQKKGIKFTRADLEEMIENEKEKLRKVKEKQEGFILGNH